MPEQIDEILERTAVPLSAHKSNDFGSGRIDALAAVNAIGDDGIEEVDNQGIIIYPNPANDIVNIVCANEIIQLIDIHGQLIDIQVKNNQIDVSHIPNGIYFIKIGKDTIKLIVKK